MVQHYFAFCLCVDWQVATNLDQHKNVNKKKQHLANEIKCECIFVENPNGSEKFMSKLYQKKCVRMLAKRIAHSHETESCYGYSQLNGNPATNGVSTFKSFNSFYSTASNL